MRYLDNREIATIIWIAIALLALVLALPKKLELRTSLKSLLSQIFILQFNLIYALAANYIILILSLLSKFDLWYSNQLKVTLLWIITIAIPNLFKINSFRDGKITFKQLAVSNFTLIVIVEFLVNFYVFNIAIELILIPFVTLVAMLVAFCENSADPKHHLVHKFLSYILGIFTFLVLSYASYELLSNPDTFLTKQTFFEFFLPAVLTILFIPFLFLLLTYSVYESSFITIDRFIKTPSLRLKTKVSVILLFNFHLSLFGRWLAISCHKNMTSYRDVFDSFSRVFRIHRLDKGKKNIPIEEGWSPFLAENFLTKEGLKTKYYNPPSYPEYDKSWSCNQVRMKLGNEFLSNITSSYSFDGEEGVVKNLKLTLNVVSYNKEKIDVPDKFLSLAKILHQKATGFDLSTKIQKGILKGKREMEEKYENFSVILKKDLLGDYGYNVNFILSNNKQKNTSTF